MAGRSARQPLTLTATAGEIAVALDGECVSQGLGGRCFAARSTAFYHNDTHRDGLTLDLLIRHASHAF